MARSAISRTVPNSASIDFRITDLDIDSPTCPSFCLKPAAVLLRGRVNKRRIAAKAQIWLDHNMNKTRDYEENGQSAPASEFRAAAGNRSGRDPSAVGLNVAPYCVNLFDSLG